MREKAYQLWKKYQRTMWYVAQTGNEIGKPLRFYSETALLLLLLDKFGVKLSWSQFLILYAAIIIIAVILGKILANTGTVKYNTTLNNNHNEELQEILTEIKKIKR